MKVIAEYLRDFVYLLYPQICASCGKALYHSEATICTSCRYHLPKTNFHLESDNPISKKFWGRVNIVMATAYYYFQKASKVQNLIHLLKYKFRTDIGCEIGALMGAALQISPHFKGINAIIPVPLHPRRQRTRGYNQSDFIAEGIAKTFPAPVIKNALIRQIYSGSQTKLCKYNRWENMKNIFALKNRAAIAGKNILLVDDVITTGATLEACASVLLQQEGTRVSIAALAYAT